MKKIVPSRLYRINNFIAAVWLSILISVSGFASVSALAPLTYPTNPQSGGTGLNGTIPSPPPTQAASIAVPTNGQSFTSQPVNVSGICPVNLLIKLYINSVFSGSAMCTSGSYTIQATLFDGTNNLVVVDYDALNQAGPNSNTVSVSYSGPSGSATTGITLTSDYARLGANPGSTLSWPIVISGGTPPYAVSVDWGDGSAAELVSQPGSGTFNITHIYAAAGVYKVLIKATDTSSNVGYLQLVGVANGSTNQGNSSKNSGGAGSTNSNNNGIGTPLIAGFIATAIILPAFTFWLGRQHLLHWIRKRLDAGEQVF